MMHVLTVVWCLWWVACTGVASSYGVKPTPTETPWPMADEPLLMAEVDFNPQRFELGIVKSVADGGDRVAVFGDHGAVVLADGKIVASDASIKAWRAAAVVPAADGGDHWYVAIDDGGRVQQMQLRGRLTDVSDRYGLREDNVQNVVPLGGLYVAFALDSAVAVADGAHVQRYDAGVAISFTGGAKIIAGVDPEGKAHLVDPDAATSIEIPLTAVTATALTPEGRLFVATEREIWLVDRQGKASLVHRANDATIRSLVAGGDRVWFAEGSDLFAIDREKIARSVGVDVQTDSQLLAATSDRIWLLNNGTLALFRTNTSEQDGLWETTIQSIYANKCSNCHAPGASSGIDLSSAEAWQERRGRIVDRVLVQMNMPPSAPLNAIDLEAVRAWAGMP